MSYRKDVSLSAKILAEPGLRQDRALDEFLDCDFSVAPKGAKKFAKLLAISAKADCENVHYSPIPMT